MGKRALLAFFLSLLVISLYNYYLSQRYPPPAKSAPALRTKAPEGATSSFVPGKSLEQKLYLNASAPEQGEDIIVETDLVKLVLTSSGARIKSYQLKEYVEEKRNSGEVKTRLEQMEQSLSRTTVRNQQWLKRELKKQTILLQKLEQGSGRVELVSLAAVADADFTPAIVWPEDADLTLAVNTATYQSRQKSLVLGPRRPRGTLEFIYQGPRGRRVKKTYSFSNSNYLIGLSIELLDWDSLDSDFLLLSGPNLGLPPAKLGRRTYSYGGPLTCFQAGQQSWVRKEKYARKEQDSFILREHKELGKVLWTGLTNKYFLLALIPQQTAKSAVIERNKFGEQKAGLKMAWDGPGPYNFQIYLGPKKESRLKAHRVGLEKAIDYGFFSPIARLIYRILVFFFGWTKNFGWAIVLLSVSIKIAFYPLTHHSFEAMQKMQQQTKVIQPELQALRERLKDNPQKLNKETLELYKRKGINPMASCQSGCLPLLLQMPVFFALYAVLYNSIELRGAGFVGWITDLSAKDPYYVLPILFGITTYVQSKLTGMGAAGGVQQEQAKLMGLLMPIMFTFLFSNFPAGVVLYWLSFNVLTGVQQLIIKKKQAA